MVVDCSLGTDMDSSQSSSQGGEGAEEALAAYTAAAASCDGPQLLPFVRFNHAHLPSTLPSTFLGAHAAFCIRDGEAPQVPDYLMAGLSAQSEQFPSDCASLALTEPDATAVLRMGSGAEKAESSIGGPKRLQRKACRRAFDFLQQRGFDFTSFKSPLIDSLFLSPSDDVPSPPRVNTLDSNVNTGGDACQEGQRATLASQLLPDAADAAAGVEAAASAAAEIAPPSKGGTGKRKEYPLLDNPLLDDVQDGDVHAPATDCQGASLDKPCNSEAPAAKRKRGLNTAAMRHKNLEQVSNECAGSVSTCQLWVPRKYFYTGGECRFVSTIPLGMLLSLTCRPFVSPKQPAAPA